MDQIVNGLLDFWLSPELGANIIVHNYYQRVLSDVWCIKNVYTDCFISLEKCFSIQENTFLGWVIRVVLTKTNEAVYIPIFLMVGLRPSFVCVVWIRSREGCWLYVRTNNTWEQNAGYFSSFTYLYKGWCWKMTDLCFWLDKSPNYSSFPHYSIVNSILEYSLGDIMCRNVLGSYNWM